MRTGILLLVMLATVTPEAAALSKKEFKNLPSDFGPHYLQNRQGKKELKQYLAAPMQCVLGFAFDETGKFTYVGDELWQSGIRLSDQLLSLNGKPLSKDDTNVENAISWAETIPMEKGDEATFVYKRGDETLKSEIICKHTRQERTDFLLPLTQAIQKDKPMVCLSELRKTTFKADSWYAANYVDIEAQCLDRAAVSRKMAQKEYNLNYYKWVLRTFEIDEHRLGIGRHKPEELFATRDNKVIQHYGFLNQQGGQHLTYQLRERYENLKRQFLGEDETQVAREQKTTDNPQAVSSGSDQASLFVECSDIADKDRKLMCFELATKLLGSNQGSSTPAPSVYENAKDDLINAFIEIDSLTDSGVNYEQFSPAVSKLRSEIRKFKRIVSRNRIPIPDSTMLKIDRTLLDYEQAKEFWNRQVQGVRSWDVEGYEDFVSKHPYVVTQRRTIGGGKKAQLNIRSMVRAYMSEASIKIEEIEKLLAD